MINHIVIALAAALALVTGGDPWVNDTATDGATTCDAFTWDHFTEGVATGEINANMWDDLTAIGWHGKADDGMEALYAPEC